MVRCTQRQNMDKMQMTLVHEQHRTVWEHRHEFRIFQTKKRNICMKLENNFKLHPCIKNWLLNIVFIGLAQFFVFALSKQVSNNISNWSIKYMILRNSRIAFFHPALHNLYGPNGSIHIFLTVCVLEILERYGKNMHRVVCSVLSLFAVR